MPWPGLVRDEHQHVHRAICGSDPGVAMRSIPPGGELTYQFLAGTNGA